MNPLSSKNSKTKSWLAATLSHPVTIALYYFAVLTAAIIYDQIADTIKTELVIYVSLGCFAAFLIILGITTLSFRASRQIEIEDRIRDLKNFIAAQQMGWIVNDKYIRSIEFGSSETWVFTRNLVNDLEEDGEIFQAVKDNLSAGNKYTYFVPDTPQSYRVINRYISTHNYKESQVSFYLIPEDNFLFYTEVIVYNIHTPQQIAIEWLPLSTTDKESQFYIQMDREHSDYLTGIGEMYKTKHPVHLEQIRFNVGHSLLP